MDNGNLAPAFILIRESKNGGQFRSEEREEKVCWFYESKKPLHLPHSVVLGHLISVPLDIKLTIHSSGSMDPSNMFCHHFSVRPGFFQYRFFFLRMNLLRNCLYLYSARFFSSIASRNS